MTPVEVFALIVALVTAIKILVVLIKPAKWMNLVNKIYEKPVLTIIISLILAVIVLYYLLVELTIVQIFAVILFLTLLMAIGVATYKKEVMGVAQKLLKKGVVKKSWLYILMWVALIIWVLYTLFI